VVPPSTAAPSAPPKLSTAPQYILRVASYDGRKPAKVKKARDKVVDLKRRFPGQPVGLLHTDDVRGLRAGFWVPFFGPYPLTPKGWAAAQAVQAKLSSTSIDTVRRRR
jgi:hypothetical protein